jgi:hypothetical protein
VPVTRHCRLSKSMKTLPVTGSNNAGRRGRIVPSGSEAAASASDVVRPAKEISRSRAFLPKGRALCRRETELTAEQGPEEKCEDLRSPAEMNECKSHETNECQEQGLNAALMLLKGCLRLHLRLAAQAARLLILSCGCTATFRFSRGSRHVLSSQLQSSLTTVEGSPQALKLRDSTGGATLRLSNETLDLYLYYR